jgi:acyl carrier protein
VIARDHQENRSLDMRGSKAMNKAEELSQLKKDLKEMLVRELSLENVRPEEIRDNEPLFGEGLGLDSLDAVEIVVLLQRNFGLEVKNMKQGREIFNSIDSLANFVLENRKP